MSGEIDPMSGEIDIAANTGFSCAVETLNESVDGLARALIATCKQQLSPHKVPERILVMNPLPRTVSGKPDRRRIKDEVSAKLRMSG